MRSGITVNVFFKPHAIPLLTSVITLLFFAHLNWKAGVQKVESNGKVSKDERNQTK